jgi:GT2 family glycosyltransferase
MRQRDDRPPVTIVVPTRDRPDLITETVKSLLQLEYPSFDILVVDQSSDHRTREVVNRLVVISDQIRYHATNTVGSSANRNIGAALTQTEFVAFTDDDCIADRFWLTALMAELNQPGVAATYGRVLSYSPESRTGAESALRAGVKRIEYHKKSPPWQVGTGGNMAFRRDELLAAGSFDPLLGAGCELQSCEDTDIAYRLLSAGKRIVFTPEAVIYHRQWKDWDTQKEMERSYGIGAGAQFAKYVRCGDFYGLVSFLRWIWHLGVRRFLSGVLRWRNRKVVYLAYCQLLYPWLGVWKSLRYPIDRQSVTYIAPDSGAVDVETSEASQPEPSMQGPA